MWLCHVSPSVSGHLSCFFLAFVNNVAASICVRVFVWTRVLPSLAMRLREELLGHAAGGELSGHVPLRRPRFHSRPRGARLQRLRVLTSFSVTVR